MSENTTGTAGQSFDPRTGYDGDGVMAPKAYDALRQLVDKGLFSEESEPGPGQVARFQAADPMLVVQRLRYQSALEQADRVADTTLLVEGA